MASRKLVRDLFIPKQPLFRQLLIPQKVSSRANRLRLMQANGYLGRREFSVFDEFSNKVKGEASRNQKFQQSVKELKDKAEELKEVKEDLRARLADLPLETLRWRTGECRTKQTTEQLYKHVDGVWTEATARKMCGHPVYKCVRGISEPVVTKSHAIAEEVKERWETSDHPISTKFRI